jgi:hypothetical protein
MSAHRFFAYGLRWASDIPLPDFCKDDTEAPADVEVRLGDVPERLNDAVDCGVLCSARPGEHLLDVPGVARYWTQDGRRITVQPAPGAADDAVSAVLSAVPIAALLHQRGALVLHASAVEVDGGAVAIAGSSAVGKSAMAAVLMRRDHKVITDDLCVITFGPAGALVHPGPQVLHVWRDVCKHLSLPRAEMRPVRAALEKYALELGECRIDSALPLRAVYVIHTSKLEPWRIAAPEKLRVTEILSNQSVGLESVRAMGGAAAHLMTAAQIARRVPVRIVTRPAQGDSFQEAADHLQKDWSALS